MSDQTIQLLKEVKLNNFKIVISSYESVADRQKIFYERLISNGISAVMYDFANHNNKWVDQGGPKTIRNDDTQKVQLLYDKCIFKVCISLVNGELYRCGRGKVSPEVFGIENVKINSGCLNIRSLPISFVGCDRIKAFLNDPNFKEYCRYCLGTDKQIPAGIQLEVK